LLESIPKRKNSKTLINDTTQPLEKATNTVYKQIIDDKPLEQTVITKTYSKDVLIGHLVKEVRRSKDNLLFAMITNIKDYYMEGREFNIICDNIVNYEDLTAPKTLELLNNYLQKFDNNLIIKVQLQEDNSEQIKAENIKKLKELFGKFVVFK